MSASLTDEGTLAPSDPMARALELARQGEGAVEPNPMVGCVVVSDGEIVGEGFHERFGGDHAEVNALRDAGDRAQGATVYVTLEPCCHHGKMPPCIDALVAAGVDRVVVAIEDPNPKVAGKGIEQLSGAGIECTVGHGQAEAEKLMAPYLKLSRTGRPWVIAKWAMTLDGKIATQTGESRWISGEESRRWVHTKRGQVDAVVVGAGTLVADDPLLNPRPAGQRTPTRIVVADSRPVPADKQLFHTQEMGPVLLFGNEQFPKEQRDALKLLGVDVVEYPAGDFGALLDELGARQMTNVLVEGGGKLLGRLFDARLVDEVHTFISPQLFGGTGASSPVEGVGADKVSDALQLLDLQAEPSGQDLHVWGRF